MKLEHTVIPLALGTKTQWGKIGMVGFTGRERYYWMIDKHGCVSMMPACVVEKSPGDACDAKPDNE